MTTRRDFLSKAASVGASVSASTIFASDSPQGTSKVVVPVATHSVGLDGSWRFRLDPNDKGEGDHWYQNRNGSNDWNEVQVPHSWQISPESAEYTGTAWYQRILD